jgi:transcriptional regulator with GAF, ATPase, and Fis domain
MRDGWHGTLLWSRAVACADGSSNTRASSEKFPARVRHARPTFRQRRSSRARRDEVSKRDRQSERAVSHVPRRRAAPRKLVLLATSFRRGNEPSRSVHDVLWSGEAAAVSESFKQLLLELAQQRSLEDLLPQITRRLAEHEDVALARVWLLDEGDACGTCANATACTDRARCLHLAASASRPRGSDRVWEGGVDGAFRRIPIGAFKVGLVAATRSPVLVTDPAHDRSIRRPDWVRAEAIQGFVGLPLVSRDDLVGVLGVFVRAPVTSAAVDVLRIIANHAAAAIASARAFAQLDGMRRQLVLENQLLRASADADPSDGLVGRSDRLATVLRQIDEVAPSDASVLILGESGTGKELVARRLHRRSRRVAGPFIELNCAAIPRELAESELFGHVKGAFSGAVRDRVGRFQAADGGTLFLDELGELPLDLQGKLLRVLQEGTYERVGEVQTRRADVRLVAATNRNLLAAVEAGQFRQDLYYRLAVYPIVVPPLRERLEDLPELASHLLVRICRRMRRGPLRLSAAQLAQLARWSWPGNVRELNNVLERAVISSPGEELVLRMDLPAAADPGEGPARTVVDDDWSTTLAGPVPLAAASGEPAAVLSDAQLRQRERDNLLSALARCRGKIYGRDGAAALLGVKPTTLASRLKAAGLRYP